MKRAELWACVAFVGLLGACGDDESTKGSSAGNDGGAQSKVEDAAVGEDSDAGIDGGGDGDGDGDSPGGDGDGDSAPGVHVTGSYNGEAFEIRCETPTDLGVGTQFIQQSPADLFDLWQFRCRTEDQELAVWFDLSDPVAGETYLQPEAGDKFAIQLGSPYDIQPLGRLSANRTEMSVSVTEVDLAAGRLAGSFSAAWSDEGGSYGELEGTIDVTGGWD